MRYRVLTACVLIQVCLGGLYAWSSFVPALQETWGFSAAQTQVTFGTLIAVFTVSMIFAGKLLERRGPRFVAGIAGVMVGAGYLTASLSGGSFLVLFLGIGCIVGIGTGFGYVCPLTICMKWFPERRGLVTGVAMAGFGGGAIVLSAWTKVLLVRGVDVLDVFRWIGLVYGVTILCAAAVLRVPSACAVTRPKLPPRLGQLLSEPFFQALVVGMFCGTFAGLLVIGNLNPLLQSRGASGLLATAGISAFAVGNFAGRVTWGWTADKLGNRIIPLSLGVLSAGLGLLVWLPATPVVVVSVSCLIGFGFGACFVVYASKVAWRYGPERVGSVYPVVFLAYGAAAIAGPWLGGWLYDLSSSYTSAIVASILVVVAGAAVSGRLLYMARPAIVASGSLPSMLPEQTAQQDVK